MKTDIVLATLNARYIHAAFGLRYLKANLEEFESRTRICEFTLEQRPLDIAEQLLSCQPRVIGLGVYIWNAQATAELAALLKKIAPEVVLVVGGPEVSYEQAEQPICEIADHVISGPGEGALYALCRHLFAGEQLLSPGPLALEAIKMPYYLYSDEDLAHRVLYVEASRGCPFRCEFCLSALDKTAKSFPLEPFLRELEGLYQRGARQFKFVDRTFNLSPRVSIPIMQFFLDKHEQEDAGNELFVHFEVIPDRLPDQLRALIARFPPGSLQFEVGVQTFNPGVQAIIQRQQNNPRSKENLTWLSQQSPAHIHADLIFGLPGEDLPSMAESFDTLVALQPDEIQLGILKRLRGMPMIAREAEYQLAFNPSPPYDILSTREVDFNTMQRLRRMARYWDLVANSGRFKYSLGIILGNQPFVRFMRLSDWLHHTTGRTHKISLVRLFDLLFDALVDEFGLHREEARACLVEDHRRSGIREIPRSLAGHGHEKTARIARGGARRQRAHGA